MTLFTHHHADRLPVYADTGEAFVPGLDPARFIHPPCEYPPPCPGEGKLIDADRVVWSGGRWVAIGVCFHWAKYAGAGHSHVTEGEPVKGGGG